MCVRGVELLEFRNVFNSLDAGSVGHDRNDLVRSQVDYVGLACSQVGGYQVVIVLIDGQVVEAFAPRTGKIDGGW